MSRDNIQRAIICDIDGTLSHGIGVSRKPYEWNKVGSDTLDETIARLLHVLNYGPVNYEIILVSGRDSVCRSDTEYWLKQHGIKYDQLFMRPEGDKREDVEVKREIYENHIKDNYDVEFVLDDRNRVVKMWREEGLKVLQVADGDF